MADYRQADLDEARRLAGHLTGSKTLERIARALAERERKGARDAQRLHAAPDLQAFDEVQGG